MITLAISQRILFQISIWWIIFVELFEVSKYYSLKITVKYDKHENYLHIVGYIGDSKQNFSYTHYGEHLTTYLDM